MYDSIYEELGKEITEELTFELKKDASFDADILSRKVKSAIREVIMKREYSSTSYNEKQILNDLNNYYSVIRNVALYDYNQIGAEGQQSHSENSINRTWINRDELFKGVHAFVKVL